MEISYLLNSIEVIYSVNRDIFLKAELSVDGVELVCFKGNFINRILFVFFFDLIVVFHEVLEFFITSDVFCHLTENRVDISDDGSEMVDVVINFSEVHVDFIEKFLHGRVLLGFGDVENSSYADRKGIIYMIF